MQQNKRPTKTNSKQVLNFSSLQSLQHGQLQQQKCLHLQLLVSTFFNPSIKKLQSHNSNKTQRSIIQIAQNFDLFLQKLEMMKIFCEQYKQTLETYFKEEKHIMKGQKQIQSIQENEQKQQENIPQFLKEQFKRNMNQNDIISHNQQQITKPLIVLPVKGFQTDKRQLQQSINKLKVMIVKVNTKQSSSFQHNYSSYISRLKYTLKHSSLDQKRFKVYKKRKILYYLSKKYSLLSTSSTNIYPEHPNLYNLFGGVGIREFPLFFINFFSQQLLFINYSPIKATKSYTELLYCPIILQKKAGQEQTKISPWYMSQLIRIQPLWKSYLFIIKVYHEDTSIKKPVFYSHVNIKAFSLPIQLKNDIEDYDQAFNFMQHKSPHLQNFIRDLQSIKMFVYQFLIFNHIRNVFTRVDQANSDKYSKNQFYFKIPGNFKVEFSISTDPEQKYLLIDKLNGKQSNKNIFSKDQTQQNIFQSSYQAQLITDLLLFYKRKNLFTLKRQSIRQEIQNLFKNNIFKMLTQKIQYRTVNPSYQGAQGLYYYQKNSVRKQNVKHFLNNFSKSGNHY